ncbi:MAG: hypothetical protein JNK05_34420 [Myxococcales bacterium]|nr:hypothetical protein [Myxococcales bacterium]
MKRWILRSVISMAAVSLALGACAPAPATDSGVDSGVDATGGGGDGGGDSASGAKPTCVLIGERCHEFDGMNATATMCHRVGEAPSSTEAACVAIRDQCLAACPEGDGGHSHNEDAAADGAAGHDH